MEYGKSPCQDGGGTGDQSINIKEKFDKIEYESELGLKIGNDLVSCSRCAVHGCKSKAMASTKFCHGHILSDGKQRLYMGCNYVYQEAYIHFISLFMLIYAYNCLQAGPILCGKPIVKCTVSALCAPHFQKAEKHVARVLKKAGLNGSTTYKVAPNFHVIIA
ncbi:uncharacterized protein [Rutidosis leptorrhynchoides]|uniref:uncharacterized protein n=1 Tax=Rutidosis leptorrhynchoides TaxID=125765 RepID=UPI003A9975E5